MKLITNGIEFEVIDGPNPKNRSWRYLNPYKRTGIYVFYNTVTTKCYVGKAFLITRRRKEHYFELNNKCSNCPKLQASWNKHGPDVFQFHILEFCEKEELKPKETEWIAKLDSYKNGYDSTPGGEGVAGVVWTEERRNGASDRLKEQFKDPEFMEAHKKGHQSVVLKCMKTEFWELLK